LSSTSTTRRFVSVRTAIGVGAAVVLAGLMFGPVTGADFEDHESVPAAGSTATLNLTLSGDGPSGAVEELDFTNLVPGETRSERVTLKNDGSIPGEATLHVTNPDGTNVPTDKLNLLKVGTAEKGLMTPDQLLESGGVIELGELQPGETKQVTVQVSLDRSAGRDWQGVTFGADTVFVLKQLN